MNLLFLMSIAAGLAVHTAPPSSVALPLVTSPQDAARIAVSCLSWPAEVQDAAARLVSDHYEADGVSFEGTADTIRVLPDGSCVDGYRVKVPGDMGVTHLLPPSSFTPSYSLRQGGTYVLLYIGPDNGGQLFAGFRILNQHRTPLGSIVYEIAATE